jgi:hypothetical protein
MLAAHQYLCETLHILHQDISIGNILLYRAEEGQEATGLLIDFDFSTTFIPEKASESVPEGNLSEASEAHNTVLGDKVDEDYVNDAAADDEVADSGSSNRDDIQSRSSMSTTDDGEDRIWTVGANSH